MYEGVKTFKLDIDNYCNYRFSNYQYKSDYFRLCYAMANVPAFRSVFYYRCEAKQRNKLLIRICKIFCKPVTSIELGGKIGEGLFLAHNYCTIIPKVTGVNLSVMGDVTVSVKSGGNPSIGDNVYLGANSVLIGDINIGDNVIVGAGAVVVDNVPSNCIVAGVPAKIIRYF